MFDYVFAVFFAALGVLIFLFPVSVSFLCFGLSAYSAFNSGGVTTHASSLLQLLINS